VAQRSITGVNGRRLVAVVEQSKSLGSPPTKVGRINNIRVTIQQSFSVQVELSWEMASSWIYGIFFLLLAKQQSLFLLALASSNVSMGFLMWVMCSVLFCFFLDLNCLVGLCFSLVLAGSHCVYGREAAWRAWTRSRLAPWDPIKYTWKVSVLTSFCQCSYLFYLFMFPNVLMWKERRFDCCCPWSIPLSLLVSFRCV